MVLIIFLLFHLFVIDSNQEKHSLHYRFIALTKADLFPKFSAKAVCDDMQMAHYSNDKQAWVRDNLTVDEWNKAPAEPPETREWFLDHLYDLSKCKHHAECSELHVLQRITGCNLEKFPDGTRKSLTAFDKYAFDGNRFIAFDYDSMQWTEKSPKAKETKKKWDRETGRNELLKSFLTNCMDWVSTFNNTKKNTPEVYVFARKVPDDHSKLNLSCIVTGFYPRDIEMNIRLNRTNLENQIASGVRPNHDGSFQMRTSVKIDRNHKESYDCFVIHSSLTEPVSVEWDGKCSNCETDRPVAGKLAAVVFVIVFLSVIVCCIYKRRSNVLISCNARYGAVTQQSTHSYPLSSHVQRT